MFDHPSTTPLARTAAAALLLGAALYGCTRSDPPPSPPTPPATPSVPRLADRHTEAPPTTAAPSRPSWDAGIRYTLPAALCPAADLTALKEILPQQEERPLVNSPGLCDTAVRTPAMVVSVTVNAELFPNAGIAWAYYTTARRLARGTPTDIPAAGTAAFFTGGPTTMELVTFHGNLALHVTCATINDRQQLPADIPARLARVAAATYTHLTP